MYKQKNLGNLLFHSKDKLDVGNKSGVYQFNCADCNSFYIGQSERSIETRIKEHFNAIRHSDSSAWIGYTLFRF